jgi:hypothetical protein
MALMGADEKESVDVVHAPMPRGLNRCLRPNMKKVLSMFINPCVSNVPQGHFSERSLRRSIQPLKLNSCIFWQDILDRRRFNKYLCSLESILAIVQYSCYSSG